MVAHYAASFGIAEFIAEVVEHSFKGGWDLPAVGSVGKAQALADGALATFTQGFGVCHVPAAGKKQRTYTEITWLC